MYFPPIFYGGAKNMEVKYINHYTVSTSHNRVSYPGEVNKGLYFKLKNIVDDAINGKKTEILEGIYLTLTADTDCYAATLWLDDSTPLITTLGADTKSGRDKIHKAVMDDYSDFMPQPIIIPVCPVIVDVILPPAILRPDIFEWTGDLTKCLGWMLIAPDKIKP